MSDGHDHLGTLQSFISALIGQGGVAGEQGPARVYHHADPKTHKKKESAAHIRLKREAKAAHTRHHTKHKKEKMGSGTQHLVKLKMRSDGIGHDWVKTTNKNEGTHIYTHHDDRDKSKIEPIAREEYSPLQEMVPGSATEKYGKMAAKMRRLEKRGIKNHPQYPREKKPEKVAEKQKKRARYLKGSLTRVKNSGDDPENMSIALTPRNNFTVRPKKGEAFATNKGTSTKYVKPGGARTALDNMRRRSGVRRTRNQVAAFLDALTESFELYQEWLAENSPSEREIGKESLTRIYAAETPGQGCKCKKCGCKKCKCKSLNEVAPPGREDQVKALKKKFPKDKAFAIAWASYNKRKR